jgi:glycerophosphoryl diester phosphodiesterase
MPSDPPSPAAIARAALGDFRRTWLAVAAFEVAFKALLAPVAALAAAGVLARLVARTGHTAVNNNDIVAFLLTPTGIVLAILAGIAALASVLFQTTGVLAVAALRLSGPPTPRWWVKPGWWTAAVTAIVGAAVRVLRLGAVQLAALVLVSMPFAGLGGLIFLAFLSGQDINYYLADRPPAFWAAAVLAGLLALAATAAAITLYIRWSLALPILLFEGGSARAALRESAARVRGAYRPIGVTLLGWRLVCGAVGAGSAALFGWLAAELLDAAGPRPRAAVPVAAGLFVLHGLLVGLGSFVLASGHGLMTLRWYVARGGTVEIYGADHPATAPAASRKWLIWLAIAAGVAGGAAVLLLGFDLIQPLGVGGPIEVTAHRGYADHVPENSLGAFRAAIESGADWAELDVQLTADNVVLVQHDQDFARVGGDPRRPGQLTLAETQQLTLRTRAGQPVPGEHPPPLKSVIDLARGRIKLNVELKVYAGDRRIAAATAKLLRDEQFEDQCVVASLDYEALQLAKAANPRLRTAAIVSVKVGDLSRLAVDALSVNVNLATDELLRNAREQGKEVMVWTVDDVWLARRLVGRGVRNLITNDPPPLVALREDEAELTDAERLLLAYRSLLGARH